MGIGNYWKIKIFILLILTFFITANVCLAAADLNLKDAFNTGGNAPLEAAASQGAGFNTSVEAPTIIGFIISLVLQLMGVVFLVMAIYAGYNWMMARGNEEMVEKAKNTLTNAIIGIVIVISAYAISYFILSQISTKALKEADKNAIKNLEDIGSNQGPYQAADESTLTLIIGAVISAALALIGAIFLVLILYAGYHWMTARGEEEKVEKAKDTINRAIVGLIIVVGSYVIWKFVFYELVTR